jgi:hypothetical protein
MQHEFSLSWRERRDAMVKRRLVKNVRLYSQKVEHYEVAQKCYRSIRIFFVTHRFNMGMNRDKHRADDCFSKLPMPMISRWMETRKLGRNST